MIKYNSSTQKIFNHLLICMNLYQHAKNHFIPSVHSWDTVNFRVQMPHPHPFLIMPNQKMLVQLLIFVNLYQHAKNEAIWSICSGEIVDLKTLQSDWLIGFWPISQEQDFSQYRICARTQDFPNFWSKKSFFQKLWLWHTTL